MEIQKQDELCLSKRTTEELLKGLEILKENQREYEEFLLSSESWLSIKGTKDEKGKEEQIQKVKEDILKAKEWISGISQDMKKLFSELEIRGHSIKQ